MHDSLTTLPAECLKNLVAFDRDGKPNSTGAKAYRPERVPPLTFIVVGKRYAAFSSWSAFGLTVVSSHHVRFFPMSPYVRNNRPAIDCTLNRFRSADGDRSGNCPPGFVVDGDIVSPSYPNFYLQSHSGIQGSALLPQSSCKG